MNDTLPPEVRTRVDAHLDAVESQLRTAGADRTQRRGIVDDLETQILDMLAAQKNEPPGLADVDAVLARLDPPGAYSNKETWPAEPSAATPRISEPRLCSHAKQAALCLAAALTGLIVCGISLVPQSVLGTPPPPPPFWNLLLLRAMLVVAAVAGIFGPLLGTALGWLAVEQIRASNGRLYGMALAVIEALLVPLLVIWLGTYSYEYWFEVTQFGNRAGAVMQLTGMERERLVAYRLIWIVCAVVLSVGLAWILRLSTGPKRASGSRNATQTGSASVLASSRG